MCLSKPRIYLFMLATQTMNSLFTSCWGHEKYEKNYNYSYARIKHIEVISLLRLTYYILVDDPFLAVPLWECLKKAAIISTAST